MPRERAEELRCLGVVVVGAAVLTERRALRERVLRAVQADAALAPLVLRVEGVDRSLSLRKVAALLELDRGKRSGRAR